MTARAASPVTDRSLPLNPDGRLTIALVADTHLWRTSARRLPPEVIATLTRWEPAAIVHAGDLNDDGVLAMLSEIAPVLAVAGNNDDPALRLPERIVISAGEHHIGVVHGHGGASARSHARAVLGGTVDVAVYGHSHRPMIERLDGTLFVNPGSPTDRRAWPHFGIGRLQIDLGGITPELWLFRRPDELTSGAALIVGEAPG